MFGSKPVFDIKTILQTLETSFKDINYKVSKNKTFGPVIGDGFNHDYFEVTFGSAFYYVMVHARLGENNKTIDVIFKATYNKQLNFSTCPYFYRQLKSYRSSISLKSIKNEEDLKIACDEFVSVESQNIKATFEQFKIDINSLIEQVYSQEDVSKYDALLCMFSDSAKKEVLFKEEIFDVNSREKIYNITKDSDFIPEILKDLFLF